VRSRYARAPSPTPTSSVTASTPITTPSIVSAARILLAVEREERAQHVLEHQ
jgi:hypothetical protein